MCEERSAGRMIFRDGRRKAGKEGRKEGRREREREREG